MDQRTGRKGAEEEEAETEGQERTKRSTRGTRGEKEQSAVRTDLDRQRVNQPVAVEQERSAVGMEERGTDQAERRYPLTHSLQFKNDVIKLFANTWPFICINYIILLVFIFI